MIDKDSFVELIKHLKRDEEYKSELNKITSKFNQDNSFCFSNNDFSSAFDILLRYALDDTEWMYDCVWDYVLDDASKIIFHLKQEDDSTKKIICSSAEDLYDVLISEELSSKSSDT